MRCSEFQALLMEGLEEGRDPATTAEAASHLDSCADCRRDAAELQRLWQALPVADPVAAADLAASPRMTARFEESLRTMLAARDLPARPAGEPARGGRVVTGPWNHTRLTALAATLVVGIGLGFLLGGKVSTNAEVRALRAEMRSASEVVATALMTHESASERLRGVAFARGALSGTGDGDARLIETLLERVRNDPSDNVRVAAVEALAAAVTLAHVRDGLLATIGSQESPEVQAVLLETLARFDRGIADAALASGDLDDGVRQWFQVMVPTYLG